MPVTSKCYVASHCIHVSCSLAVVETTYRPGSRMPNARFLADPYVKNSLATRIGGSAAGLISANQASYL
jgi:hypothetical protein